MSPRISLKITRPPRLNARFIPGVKGEQGDQGIQGEQGIQGIQGETGATGEQGPQGETGAAGADGVVQSIVAGDNIAVDSTDPANPIVSSSAAGVTDGDKGDIVVSSSGATWTVDPVTGTGNFIRATAVREKLTANRTYYVRTDGNNSNDGLTDSSGGAKLTLQGAGNAAAAVDNNGFNIAIEVRDGTYTGGLVVNGPWVGRGTVTVNGESASGTIISTTSSTCFLAQNCARLTVTNLEMRTTTSGDCLSAGYDSTIFFSGVRFGTCAAFHTQAFSGSTIAAIGNYSIVGGAVGHLHTPFTGVINTSGITVTLTGTPAFSTYFAGGAGNSIITIVSTTYSGSATGPRFLFHKGAHLETNGADPDTYLPGNSAGSLNSGGTVDSLLGVSNVRATSGQFTLNYGTTINDPVAGTGALANILYMNMPTGQQGGMLIDTYASTPGFTTRAALGTNASPAALTSGSALMEFAGRGHDGSNFTTISKARFRALATETWSGSAQGTSWVFDTTDTGTTTRRSVVQFDGPTTAGQTGLMLWDVNSGLLQRVLVGTNGTGPGGVGRALYIANV